MPDMQPPAQPVKATLHWPSLLQLILSLLAAFLLLGAAVVIFISVVYKYITNSALTADLIQPSMTAASLAFAGVLVLPSAWYAWRHIAFLESEPAPYRERRGFGLALTAVVVVVVAGALFLGNWAAQNDQVAWWLLPPLNIIANGLPALWLVYIGTRRLIPGTPRRLWGVFASGLVLGPFIILILELLLLFFVGLLALIWIMLTPSLANQLYNLVLRLQSAGSNPDGIIRQLIPFLVNPGIIFLIFAYISVLVPLLEEALKPIGVWFLSGQKITPAQGFGYGVLSGAGFGLFENLGNTSGGATDWAIVASTRISTLMLHCFTAGLVGWALISAWKERRYLRLLATYLIAVFVHGLWNALALTSAVASIQGYSDVSLPAYLQQIGAYSSYGIIALGAIVLVLYLGSNAFFQRGTILASSPAPWQSPGPLAPDSTSQPDTVDTPIDSESDTSASQSSTQEDRPSTPDSDDNSFANLDNSPDKGNNQ